MLKTLLPVLLLLLVLVLLLQVESLRQLSDAAGGQLVITQGKLDQLKSDKDQHEQQLQAQLQALQVTPGHCRQ